MLTYSDRNRYSIQLNGYTLGTKPFCIHLEYAINLKITIL